MSRPSAAIALIPLAVLIGCSLFDEEEPVVQQRPAPLPKPAPVQVISRGFSAMGTLFEITIASDDGARTTEAIGAAFDEIRRVEALLTTRTADAALVRVNDAAGGQPISVPAELIRVVEEAVAVSERTAGAFDVTFASMGRIWDFNTDKPTLPDPRQIQRGIRRIDYRGIEIDRERGSLRLARKGMRLSLGGIAKGYAADRAGIILRQRGFDDFAIFGGGDQLFSGNKGTDPWSVGIRDPRQKNRHFAKISLPGGGAVDTSGDYERFFVIDGRRYHHIINPATGYPATEAVSVTVLAPRAALADALATGLFVLGPEKGMELVEADQSLEAIYVDTNLEIHVSSGLRSQVEVTPIQRIEEE